MKRTGQLPAARTQPKTAREGVFAKVKPRQHMREGGVLPPSIVRGTAGEGEGEMHVQMEWTRCAELCGERWEVTRRRRRNVEAGQCRGIRGMVIEGCYSRTRAPRGT